MIRLLNILHLHLSLVQALPTDGRLILSLLEQIWEKVEEVSKDLFASLILGLG